MSKIDEHMYRPIDFCRAMMELNGTCFLEVIISVVIIVLFTVKLKH